MRLKLRRAEPQVEAPPDPVVKTVGFDGTLAGLSGPLDAITACILVADLDLTLRWVNQAADDVLRQIEPDVQRTFGISHDELVGGSIHRFHRDPQRVERVLAESDEFRLPHQAEFSFGAVTLRTNIDRLQSPSGHAVGYIVTFENISELLREESRALAYQEQLASAAVAIEQLNQSITEISANAAEASTLAAEAERETGRISDAAAELDARRAEIDAAVESIDAVASLTQLLALNATIEAARAGEAGKGFAVVANEVKDLATETARVTAEIGSKLRQNGEAIGRLRAEIEAMGEQMEQINSYQTGIAGAVEEQQATSASLAHSIMSVAH